ncbi:MAG: Lrp/AsnC family transcriptional regulator [Bacteroidia bacterium]|jgi:Lrp/AsnC family leucine-responsive transcriptional regulator|nr:Lrp/AsnC family transcriptional regulator [uncultured Flavobacterium sp.]MBP6757331.1 Lrp/AsnC family transcriptional regulator [Bacteroidia bacterium]
MEQLSIQELDLLRLLQKDSAFEVNDLMKRLNMSRTTVYERIKKLENEGYIKGYVAIIDREKIGLNFTVIVTVSLISQRAEYVEEFSEQVAQLAEVVEAYVTGGIFDYVLKVMVKDLKAYNDFIAKKLSIIPNISNIKSSFVMSYIKQSTELPF